MKLSPQEIIKRYKSANAHKDNWRSVYEDAYRYCLPMRNLHDGYYESNAPGQDKMSRVFDSTAIQSTHRFANRIQSGLFPPQNKWCRLIPGEEIPPERRLEVQRVLDNYSDKMFGVMRQSSFDIAMGEFLLELAIGTACLLIQPGDEVTPIRYTAVPTFLISFEEGPFGTVEKVYRRMRKPFNVLDQEFPDIKIPQEISNRYKDNETEQIEIIEFSCYDKYTGKYHYQIVDESGNHELVYRELSSFPWVIARYSKMSGERYGRGPCLTALPDIKTLNRVKELLLKNASLTIGGVFLAADDGVLNPSSVAIVPGAIIPVARNGGPQGESLKPLPRNGDPNLSQLIIQDLVTSIKRIMLDENIAPDNMSARTATQISHEISQLSQNLGSAFGRLINETMYPVVRRTLEVMNEMGMIDLPLSVNGLQVRIEPHAPIPMAQNMTKVQEVMQFLQISSQLGPQAQMFVKQDAVIDFIAETMGLPADIITTPEEREQMMQQAMAMAQQQGEMSEQQPTEQPIQ